MLSLFKAKSHFNLANIFTMVNIICGLVAIYLISQHNFFYAIIFAWIGGAFDILDGKIARRFNLSNEFGIQLDSFADFLSFVLVPVFLIFQAIYSSLNGLLFALAVAVSIYYVISGLRRLIQFNIETKAGDVEKFFIGVPTPLGAILLWFVYIAETKAYLPSLGVIVLMGFIGWLLNSKVKVPHP